MPKKIIINDYKVEAKLSVGWVSPEFSPVHILENSLTESFSFDLSKSPRAMNLLKKIIITRLVFSDNFQQSFFIV